MQAPASLANGTYDLEIALEQPSTSTVIASDTNAASVVYAADLIDHVLVIDRSFVGQELEIDHLLPEFSPEDDNRDVLHAIGLTQCQGVE